VYLSGISIQTPSRVGRSSPDKSPAAQEIPVSCRKFPQKLEAAAAHVCQINEAREPEQAQLGQGEIEMAEQDPVESNLQELRQ
jgi:hypothetical protein